MKTKISGRRTRVTIGGKKARGKEVKVGMTCNFHLSRLRPVVETR